MSGMVRTKVTVTLDRSKAEVARSLVGAGSTSGVIDLALDRLIRAERRRADIAAYRLHPLAMAEADLGGSGDTSGLDDDTDWEALYPESDS